MPSSDGRGQELITPAPADSSSSEYLPMTPGQAAQLKQLARDAYDIDAFDLQLTQGEAQRRITTLQAKLKLQGEPPHTQ